MYDFTTIGMEPVYVKLNIHTDFGAKNDDKKI